MKGLLIDRWLGCGAGSYAFCVCVCVGVCEWSAIPGLIKPLVFVMHMVGITSFA